MRALLMSLAALLATACATPRTRAPNSAPERLAGLRESDRETGAEAVEERFATEADRKRREDARLKRANQQRRVDVVEKPVQKKPRD